MEKHHWNTWGLLLVGLAAQLAGLHSWHEALTPPFIAGCLAVTGAVLKAMVQDSPSKE